MPENDGQCVIPVKCYISFKTMLCPNFLMVWYANIIIFNGFVVMCMYMIIKQLFHACSGNSQNYCPSVLEITVDFGLRPQATVLKSSPPPQVNSFGCPLNRHEITVYCVHSVSVTYDIRMSFIYVCIHPDQSKFCCTSW
jgi:hypothetical protein